MLSLLFLAHGYTRGGEASARRRAATRATATLASTTQAISTSATAAVCVRFRGCRASDRICGRGSRNQGNGEERSVGHRGAESCAAQRKLQCEQQSGSGSEAGGSPSLAGGGGERELDVLRRVAPRGDLPAEGRWEAGKPRRARRPQQHATRHHGPAATYGCAQIGLVPAWVQRGQHGQLQACIGRGQGVTSTAPARQSKGLAWRRLMLLSIRSRELRRAETVSADSSNCAAQ